MQLVFVRLNYAIRTITDLYEAEKIADIINFYQTKEKYPGESHYLDGHERFIYSIHQDLENEINQVIFTHNHNALVLFFERLKGVLELYGVKDFASVEIIYRVEQHNKTKRETLTEQQLNPAWGFSPIIDIIYLPQYLQYAENVTQNFKTIIETYVKMYDEGKIQSTILFQPAHSTNVKSLPEPIKKEILKLKLNLTVDEIAFFLKLLSNLSPKVFDEKYTKTILRFVVEHFTSKGKDSINLDRLNNRFYEKLIAQDVIDSWVKYLTKMLAQARKSEKI